MMVAGVVARMGPAKVATAGAVVVVLMTDRWPKLGVLDANRLPTR